MRYGLVFAVVFFAAGYGEDFITEFEYGQMLYHDPRGASCAACHGETGRGGLITEYTNRQGQYVALNGPDIRHATLDLLRRSVHKGAGVMPRYFLTEKEIRTIHAYLQKLNKRREPSLSDLFEKTEENQR